MKMSKRDSNFELLRIIAMLFIVVFHISTHAQGRELPTHKYICAITTGGVNLFILISGYFGIKLKWKSLLNIIGQLIFFYIVTLFLIYYFFDYNVGLTDIARTFLPLSSSNWWFVRCYLMLMLISPAINIVLEKSTNKQLLFLMCVVTYLSCISGFAFKNTVNHNGFNLFNFTFIYMLGGVIRKYDIPNKIKSIHLVAICVIATFFVFIYHCFNAKAVYNNPALIIQVVALFCLIAKIHFKSTIVNSLATCMFPVYLLQDSPFGFKIYKVLYQYGKEQHFRGSEYILTLLFYTIVLFTCAILLEKARQWLMNKSIEHTANYLRKKLNLFGE